MNRVQWKETYRLARKGRVSMRFYNAGQLWSVAPRSGVARLRRDSWYYDRPLRAQIALALELTAHMRRRFKITSGSGVAAARRLRMGGES